MNMKIRALAGLLRRRGVQWRCRRGRAPAAFVRG